MTVPGSGEAAPDSVPEISIVVPVFNEEGAAAALAREIAGVFAEGPLYEMIFVDDASRDGTGASLAAAGIDLPALRVLRHRFNAGQSRALRTGVLAARAPVVIMLDGDGQNDPADAPRLLRRLREGPPELALVGGRRRTRQDGAAKRWASRIANAVRRRVLDDGAEDTGCGLKVFSREAFLALPYFDHMHRYLPALMLREGRLVAFEDVGHRPRTTGRSKYTNGGRLAAAASDLLGVLWLRSRARDPGGAEAVRAPSGVAGDVAEMSQPEACFAIHETTACRRY